MFNLNQCPRRGREPRTFIPMLQCTRGAGGGYTPAFTRPTCTEVSRNFDGLAATTQKCGSLRCAVSNKLDAKNESFEFNFTNLRLCVADVECIVAVFCNCSSRIGPAKVDGFKCHIGRHNQVFYRSDFGNFPFGGPPIHLSPRFSSMGMITSSLITILDHASLSSLALSADTLARPNAYAEASPPDSLPQNLSSRGTPPFVKTRPAPCVSAITRSIHLLQCNSARNGAQSR